MPRGYEVVSGVVFAFVAIGHALRAVEGWSLQLEAWTIPMWMSWVAAGIAALLSAWAFRRSIAQRRSGRAA
jgi:sterol desaturase/sphingolipid hydroxylase (fatty acid hydroxylase superfamily)